MLYVVKSFRKRSYRSKNHNFEWGMIKFTQTIYVDKMQIFGVSINVPVLRRLAKSSARYLQDRLLHRLVTRTVSRSRQRGQKQYSSLQVRRRPHMETSYGTQGGGIKPTDCGEDSYPKWGSVWRLHPWRTFQPQPCSTTRPRLHLCEQHHEPLPML